MDEKAKKRLQELRDIYKQMLQAEEQEVVHTEESMRANMETFHEFAPYREEANRLIDGEEA